MSNSKQQEVLLDQAKSVTEASLQFVYATKDCGGNPKVNRIFNFSIKLLLLKYFFVF